MKNFKLAQQKENSQFKTFLLFLFIAMFVAIIILSMRLEKITTGEVFVGY